MIGALCILVFSAALFCYYCQVTIQKILRRSFREQYFRNFATANGLEFPALRNAFAEANSQIDYSRLRTMISGDFHTLTYMLKNAAKFSRGGSGKDRLLMFYFRLVLVSLTVRHGLRLAEKPAVLHLTEILQFFANLVGERMASVRVECLSASSTR